MKKNLLLVILGIWWYFLLAILSVDGSIYTALAIVIKIYFASFF